MFDALHEEAASGDFFDRSPDEVDDLENGHGNFFRKAFRRKPKRKVSSSRVDGQISGTVVPNSRYAALSSQMKAPSLSFATVQGTNTHRYHRVEGERSDWRSNLVNCLYTYDTT